MEFQIEQAVTILSQTPATLRALLEDAPDAWVMQNNGGDTWSPFQTLGHMTHGDEADWINRTMIILEHGESQPFAPFDRFAMFEKYKDWSPDRLLDHFQTLREDNLDKLRSLKLTPELLDKRGTHPSLGAVQLRQLLATWVAHDFNHLGQIVEVMSRHYKEAVGPWVEMLPILTR